MLNKNIYILYPPGYSGSYINWCLSKSEKDLSTVTVDDPLNKTDSIKYGGAGTSHLHHRIPTHCGIKELITWIALNKPTENKIFVVNATSYVHFQETIYWILTFDRDPIFIQITATDKHTQAIGNLNCVTKWPLYFSITGIDEKFQLTFPYENTIENRNKFVVRHSQIFSTSYPLDPDLNYDEVSSSPYYNYRDWYAKWYNTRHAHNPHEVNNTLYVEPCHTPRNYYAIDLMQVYGSNFIELLKSIVEETNAGEFNFEHVTKYHPTYVNAQSNLIFLDEIKEFNRTNILTEYLCSHPLIQAYVIMELLPKFKNNDWLDQSLHEIVERVNFNSIS